MTFFNSPCELLEGVTYRLPGLKNIRKRKKKSIGCCTVGEMEKKRKNHIAIAKKRNDRVL